jgi:phage protein U
VGLPTPHSPHTVKKLIVTKVEQRKSWMDLRTMERVGDRWKKIEGSCSTGQSPQWAVVSVEEEEEEEEEEGQRKKQNT